MDRYGTMEVFNIYVYDGSELLFTIETMNKFSIKRDLVTRSNTLYIDDVIIDSNLMKMVLGGELDGRALRIVGMSKWSDLSNRYSDVGLDIAVANLIDYSINNTYQKNKVSMVFELPLYNPSLDKNLTISISDKKQ